MCCHFPCVVAFPFSRPLTLRLCSNASFIAISTLTSDLNFYTKLISKVDPMTHKPIFKSVQIQLACQACIDAERAHECTHNMHLIPAWHNEEKHTRLKAIMSDRPGMHTHTKDFECAAFRMLCQRWRVRSVFPERCASAGVCVACFRSGAPALACA